MADWSAMDTLVLGTEDGVDTLVSYKIQVAKSGQTGWRILYLSRHESTKTRACA